MLDFLNIKNNPRFYYKEYNGYYSLYNIKDNKLIKDDFTKEIIEINETLILYKSLSCDLYHVLSLVNGDTISIEVPLNNFEKEYDNGPFNYIIRGENIILYSERDNIFDVYRTYWNNLFVLNLNNNNIKFISKVYEIDEDFIDYDDNLIFYKPTYRNSGFYSGKYWSAYNFTKGLLASEFANEILPNYQYSLKGDIYNMPEEWYN